MLTSVGGKKEINRAKTQSSGGGRWGGVECKLYLHSSSDKPSKPLSTAFPLPPPSPLPPQLCSGLEKKPNKGLGNSQGRSIHQPQIRWLVLVASHIRQFDSFTRLPEMKSFIHLAKK